MFPHEIEKLITKKGNRNEVFGNILYVFMRDLHMSYREVLELPIPVALELINKIKSEQKENEKLNNKIKSRRR